jgi:hypothetical protein
VNGVDCCGQKGEASARVVRRGRASCWINRSGCELSVVPLLGVLNLVVCGVLDIVELFTTLYIHPSYY